jgi:hypothetical protein
MNELLNVQGIVEVVLRNQKGNILHQDTFKNLVTTAGKNFIVRKVANDTEEVHSISIGFGETAATLIDTELENVLANENILFSGVDTVETNVIIFTTLFAEDVGTGIIKEVGLFTDASPQKLLCRAVLSTPFEKLATDYLTVSWKIKIG